MATAACLVAMTLAPRASSAESDAELLRLRDGFEERRDAMFQLVAGQPLKIAPKRAPLGPGRAAYTRHHSFSIMSFAMKAFWLNEFLDEANAALQENCRYYLEDKQARDDRDSWPSTARSSSRNGTAAS